MKNQLILFFKGFLMGSANLIPGVSGGTLAVILGIYDKFINVLGHFVRNFKENISFIIPILLGTVTALLTLSGIITYCLSNYLFSTVLFFTGSILGGVPMITKKLKDSKPKFSNIILFIAAFFLVTIPIFSSAKESASFDSVNFFLILKLFLMGNIASATMVIPGVSGSAVLMSIGYYVPIMNALHGLLDIEAFKTNILIILPYALGLFFGMLMVARGIEYLLKNYETKSYYAILGFIISSAVVILIKNNIIIAFKSASLLEIFFGFFLCILGFYSATKLGNDSQD